MTWSQPRRFFMTETTTLKVKEFTAQCCAGGVVSEAIKDAMRLSVENEVVVKFKHNDREYVVDSGKWLHEIYNQHP